MDYALFALDFARLGQILESRPEPPTEPSEALKWHLAKKDDAGVREIARRRTGSTAVVDAAVGIVEGDTARLSEGLNAILLRHMRGCPRGKSRFNGSHAFMSHQASALAILAGVRGLTAEIEPKFRPARVPILFIAVAGPLANPPCHIEVDLVPHAYRSASLYAMSALTKSPPPRPTASFDCPRPALGVDGTNRHFPWRAREAS